MDVLSNSTKSKSNTEPQNNSHAVLIHLSSFSSYIGLPFGSILGPLITWLIWRDENQFVNKHGKEALNFNISIILYQILAIIIGIILFLTPILSMAASDNPIGLLLSTPGLLLFISGFGLIQLFRIIAIIIAAIKASNGEDFNYPLSIKFIK
jgi:uncharacterized Tic20 family protein